jgi:hypothetical protein
LAFASPGSLDDITRMGKPTNETSTGKRLLLLLLGAGSLALSLYLPFVPVQDDTPTLLCKWAVNILFFVGSLILLHAAARGDRKQVNKAVDSFIRGL